MGSFFVPERRRRQKENRKIWKRGGKQGGGQKMDREKGGLRSTAISSLIFLIKIGLPSGRYPEIPRRGSFAETDRRRCDRKSKIRLLRFPLRSDTIESDIMCCWSLHASTRCRHRRTILPKFHRQPCVSMNMITYCCF